MSKITKITKEIKQYIIAHYMEEGARAIALRFDEKENNISRWAFQLGCSKDVNYWTSLEEKIVRTHFMKGIKCSITAKKLGRSLNAIYSRRRVMRDLGRL